MKIPLAYNLRNLRVRWTTTVMTALGVGLAVTVLVADLAFVDGLHAAFASSGNPLNVLVFRKGATSELGSTINQETYREILYQPGIARAGGRPLVSLELVSAITLPINNSLKEFTVTLRGMTAEGTEVRRLRLMEGRWFQPGYCEVVVGSFVARRCGIDRTGQHLRIGLVDWVVVGVVDGGRSAANSEVFADLDQVATDFNRRDQFTSILLQAADASSVGGLVNSLNNSQRLNVSAQPETSYYDRQKASGAPLEQLGILVSLIMSVGSCFAAMNTMYAAVARRTREIGTLRAVGFSRRSIHLSFFLESLLLAGAGGFAGCLLALPLDLITTAVGNFTTMSETAFRFHVGAGSVLAGIAFALIIGALGGVFPARMAARKEILTALREA